MKKQKPQIQTLAPSLLGELDYASILSACHECGYGYTLIDADLLGNSFYIVLASLFQSPFGNFTSFQCRRFLLLLAKQLQPKLRSSPSFYKVYVDSPETDIEVIGDGGGGAGAGGLWSGSSLSLCKQTLCVQCFGEVYLTKLDGDPDCAMSHEKDRSASNTLGLNISKNAPADCALQVNLRPTHLTSQWYCSQT